MPVIVVDDWESGESLVVEVGYDEFPRHVVEHAAANGDAEAQAWLDANPPVEGQ